MSSRLYKHPSESSGTDPEAKINTEENQPPSAEETATDPLLQLQAELAAAKIDREHWYDRFLRKAAEFDNFRKRTEKEKSASVMNAKGSVLVELLPIVDACERALGSFTDVGIENESVDQYREGVRLLYKQLKDALARLGVVSIEACGAVFDPHLHEALVREETPEYEENTVIEELSRGYLFHGRLLRPAQVKVAIRPRQKEDSSTTTAVS